MSAADNSTKTADQTLLPLHRVSFGESGPPQPTTLPDGSPAWLVTRHRDVQQVLSDARFGRAQLYGPDAPPVSDVPNLVNNPDLVFNQDGPDHLRLRRTFRRAFTPRAVARWRPWIAAMVERCLDELARCEPPVDVVAAFTLPLPIAVISELMGLDAQAQGRLRHWTAYAFSDGSHDPDEVTAALEEFAAFAAELIAERRRDPGDDLVSSLLRSADAEGGIPEAQLVSLVCGLAVGGHDSTMTMLGNCLLYLLGERPETWPVLGSDEKAAELAAERLLHLIPLGDDRGSTRHASEDVEVGGVIIPAGSVVVADCGTANRDPAVFPDRPFDELFSPLAGANLAFGAGPHYCMGAWLARLELQLALHRLAARFPELRLAEPAQGVEWRLGATSRSPLRLAVTW